MRHLLVQAIEKALDWSGPDRLGQGFVRGAMDDPAICGRLLTPTRLLDTVMRRSLAPPQLRCFRKGDELHPDAYLTHQVTRRGQTLPVANMDRLGQLLKSGCTLVLDALDSFDPTMEIACRALQWWSRELTQVNTYLTTNDAAGFSLHWDDHDVVIVQLAGEKSWEVRGSSRVAPMYRDAEPNDEPSPDIVWSGTMQAGDVMHIPRGYWHQATRTDCGEGFSLHVTFGFVKRTGVDWLNWVADRSREREWFRHDLDRWGSPDDQFAQQCGLADGVSGLLKTYPIDTYLAAREQERQPPRHVATGGVFGPPEAVICVTDFPPHIEREGTMLTVSAAGRRITFTDTVEPALRLLLSGRPVTVTAATEAAGTSVTDLVQVLIKEGLCAELTEALSSACTDLLPPGN
ncbi:JmjC domain-containing protein [Actinokineospora enzanensis]|uniref:JmjC domain-containing protein n=1 Tax=Actinokineospora enzanensis TaxID=155975 RepID=UPI00036E063A|nr:cupin domain-containing protein [Actinokineospora enzanensis]